MWCAMVEEAIGIAIQKHIFVDFYYPGDPLVRNAMSTALDALSPLRQRVVRCQFLADGAPTEDDCHAAAGAALRDVSTTLAPVLSDQAPGESFRDCLGDLFLEATDVWGEIQRARGRAVATMSPEMAAPDGENAIGRHAEYGPLLTPQNGVSGTGAEPAASVTLLFPQVLIRDDKKQTKVFNGFALWSNQKVVFQARRDSDALNNTRGTRAGDLRLPGTTKRRMSIASGSIPASPTVPKPGLRSPKLGNAKALQPRDNGPQQAKASGVAAVK